MGIQVLDLQGGTANRGLNWFSQCIGPHVLLKLILGMKVKVYVFGRLANDLFSSNFIFWSGSFIAAAE